MLALVLAGCTFIDQKVQLQPQVDVTTADLGQSKSVAIKVVDDRDDTVIGNRGIWDKGAKVSTEDDVAGVFTKAISDGLRQKGFQVQPFASDHPRQLAVYIRFLKYETVTGLWTGGNIGKAGLRVQATNDGNTYEKSYQAQSEIRTVWAGSQETNAKVINQAVSDVVKKMVEDKNLMALLAR